MPWLCLSQAAVYFTLCLTLPVCGANKWQSTTRRSTGCSWDLVRTDGAFIPYSNVSVCLNEVHLFLKVSSSSFPKKKSHPRTATPDHLPPHPHLPCLPKSNTQSACIWITSCAQTESGSPSSSKTHTYLPAWQCATTGDSFTCRKTLTERSLKLTLGRK